MAQNAIVTGGSGFIGSHLVDRLLEEKKFDKIWIIDNLVRTKTTRNIDHIINNPRIEFLHRDISKFNFNYFDSKKISHIFHLAATRINRCVEFNREGHEYIADGGFNVIDYASKNGIKLFFSSTASVYNKPKRLPIQEIDPCTPRTIYGAAKYYTECLIHSYNQMYNLDYSINRFFSVIGPRIDNEGAYTEVVFNWLNNIKNGKKEIIVYGDPKEKILDLVDVKDVVNAILLSTFISNNDVFNVSTQKGVSLYELITIIEKVTKTTLKINTKPETRTDIELARVGDVSKLKELGWEQTVFLEKSITNIWNWINDKNT